MSVDTAPSVEEACQDVLDAIEDRLAVMNEILEEVREGRRRPGTAVGLLRQQAHSIKGMAAGIGVGVLKVTAHRLEDFLNAVEALEGAALGDAQVFVDRLGEALDGKLDLTPEEIARFCRRLPAKHSFSVEDVEVRDIEILLVAPEGAGTHFVTRELAECGYRMVNVWSSADGLALAAQMRPDLIIVTNVMDELSGVDFACAIRAMPTTASIPVAVLTSQKRNHPSLAGLPAEVPLLSKSGRFADDITQVFASLGLL
ncbi:MAG: response regulator [Alphaproteobacteria bacterium]|nr:MAG: response regulator [Alphaproteobacteria bacterium]